jgi:hypothetical protein
VDQSGLKADELEQLRRWGNGLQHDPREEVSAAGRAIVLLIEEIERLHVLAWDRRLYPDDEVSELHTSLRRRLRQRLRPHPDPSDQGGFHS